MTSLPASLPDPGLLDYEQAYAELQAIVADLENEQLPLEASLALYERGQALAARCAHLLDTAELRVRKLAGDTLLDLDS